MAMDSHDVGPRYCQRSAVERDHERCPRVRCSRVAPPGCSPRVDRGKRYRLDMEPAWATGGCDDRRKRNHHVSQRCSDVLQADGGVMTRVPAFRACRTGGNARPDSFQETRLLEVIAPPRTEVIADPPPTAVWSGYGRKPAAQGRWSASFLADSGPRLGACGHAPCLQPCSRLTLAGRIQNYV
jgi:hypothetical protein